MNQATEQGRLARIERLSKIKWYPFRIEPPIAIYVDFVDADGVINREKIINGFLARTEGDPI